MSATFTFHIRPCPEAGAKPGHLRLERQQRRVEVLKPRRSGLNLLLAQLRHVRHGQWVQERVWFLTIYYRWMDDSMDSSVPGTLMVVEKLIEWVV